MLVLMGAHRIEVPQRNARRDAAIAGFTGIAGATGALAVLGLFAPGSPFPPFQLAQSFVQAAPGVLATFFIEHLGHLALPLGVVAFSAVFLSSGALFGLLIPGLERAFGGRTYLACLVALSPVWLAWFALAPAAARSAHIGGYLLSGIVAALLAPAVASHVRSRLKEAPALEGPADQSRRYLFRASAAGIGGILLGASGLSRAVRPGSDPGSKKLVARDLSPAPRPSTAPADAAFSRIPGLTSEVTSVSDFYTVDEAFVDPSLDAATWKLSVEGLLGGTVALTYDELTAMPAVERYQTLECISNPVGGDLISTTRWTGVPLKEILTKAGMPTEVVEVVFRSADGYSDSLPIEKAMDETTLIAIGMDGNALPRAHGFPARVLSLGTYGMKNPKWLTSIEVVSKPYDGFWEQRGWSKAAVVSTASWTDVPQSATVGRSATIAGLAFAGDRGISRVEISTDGGATWKDAALKSALSPYTWRLWRFPWTPTRPGDIQVMVRAWDGDGKAQVTAEAPPHPSGSRGIDSVSVRVSEPS
jgi:DMSO/TMAO reductase YedYZ molybdopterin-dependent catalytic subunit